MPGKNANNLKVGAKIKSCRLRSSMSLRQLAREAQVAVSYVSSIEKDAVSPTLTTLRKVLNALGTDLATFFANDDSHSQSHIFRKGAMKMASDAHREYTFVLPHRQDINMEIMDESFHYSEQLPEFETIESDLSGYVLKGEIVIEIGVDAPGVLKSGDAFYVPANTRVRGYCQKNKSARLLTFMNSPKY